MVELHFDRPFIELEVYEFNLKDFEWKKSTNNAIINLDKIDSIQLNDPYYRIYVGHSTYNIDRYDYQKLLELL